MKSIIFAAFLLCLAGTAAAQQGWVPLTSGTTGGLTSISLVGPDTIYVSGVQSLLSTNAGASWTHLSQRPLNLGFIRFVDGTHGWVGASDSVWRTSDGGATWTASFTGSPSCNGMIFSTRDSGCVMGNPNVRTTDGGVTWQPSNGYSENAMAFSDAAHGFVMGNVGPWIQDPSKPQAARFEYTTDGGATWVQAYAGPSADGKHSGIPKNVRGLDALSIDTLIAVGDYGLIARTYSAGIDWDTIPSPTPEHLNGVYFPDHAHGTAVGSNGIIIHTSDGGLIWTLQNSGITDGSYLYDVKFVDSLIGYTIGDGGIILKTINGGLSWVNISPLSSNEIKGTVYPQPAGLNTSLAYNLPAPQHVSLSIQNVTGATVLPVLDASLQSDGIQTVKVNTAQLASGTYTYVLQSEKYFSTGKIEVIH